MNPVPFVFAVCAVVVTVAITAIAIAALRAMVHLESAAHEFARTTREIRRSTEVIRQATREGRAAIGSVREFVPRVQAVVTRFEHLATRVTGLTRAFNGEIGIPIRSMVAVARGVRSGTARLRDALSLRPLHHSLEPGGLDHE